MLTDDVVIDSDHFLPSHDRHRGVHRVQFGDLDVRVVNTLSSLSRNAILPRSAMWGRIRGFVVNDQQAMEGRELMRCVEEDPQFDRHRDEKLVAVAHGRRMLPVVDGSAMVLSMVLLEGFFLGKAKCWLVL